jgi:S1-C subfamily serine protease
MEEVPVHIAYLDPTHDFALLRFDPAQLRQTPRVEIELDAAGCQVGQEIRVVGNDSLEKLQILAGTIARIDRNAPDLAGDYHDENTFYALAASGTRGGSSGSPVISLAGKAVALNAAAVNDTMHGFYLPLHRVVRALDAVRCGQAVPRGTLCTQLTYTSFPECVRLGVAKEFLQESVIGCKPAAGGTFTANSPPSGMLQVRRCITGTPASKALKPGDMLLEIQGKPCVDFVFFDDFRRIVLHVNMPVGVDGHAHLLRLVLRDCLRGGVARRIDRHRERRRILQRGGAQSINCLGFQSTAKP